MERVLQQEHYIQRVLQQEHYIQRVLLASIHSACRAGHRRHGSKQPCNESVSKLHCVYHRPCHATCCVAWAVLLMTPRPSYWAGTECTPPQLLGWDRMHPSPCLVSPAPMGQWNSTMHLVLQQQ
jgi:hypothetical protein